jgi:hypothetical protein
MSTGLPPQPRGPDAEHGSVTTANSAPGVPGQGSEVDPLTVLDPAKSRQATHGTLSMQLRNIERQAGVRRTL